MHRDGALPLATSVVMCTYNGAAFVREQLESIAGQTVLPDEIVIGDDGSRDETEAVVREFSAKNPAIDVRFARNETNLGSTRNFSRALGRARGAVVFFSDQDDVWEPEKVDRIVEAFRDPEVGLVFSDAILVGERGEPLHRTLWQSLPLSASEQERLRAGRARDVLLRRSVVTGATMALRARFLPLVLPISERWVHDGWIAYLVACCAKVVALARPLTRYRVHGRQQIGVALNRDLASRVRALTRRREQLRADLESSLAQFRDARLRLATVGPSFGVDGTAMSALDGKIAHLERRTIPRGRLRRAEAVAREILSAGYFRYSSGLLSIGRDLIMR